MSNNLRLSLFGLTGAVAGFILQGCFDAQGAFECTVTTTAIAGGIHPYYTKLTKVDGAGPCSELTHVYVGTQRFRTQASGGPFTVALKTSAVVDPFLGYVYSADTEAKNNCKNEEECADCTIEQSDGGLIIGDGGVVEEYVQADGGKAVGTPDPEGDDGYRPVDDANVCMVVEEHIERRDPSDPKGKNLNAIGKMPQFPTAGVCAVSDLVGGVQNFQAEDLELTDGTTQTLPAITYKAEWTNFNVINSAKVQGTAFTANLKFTEGSCVANYKAVGFWPEVACSNKPSEGELVTSGDCEPAPDLDAGRVVGSGINPEFKPKCDTKLGVCVPTVDVTIIK